jgi:SAM-dependent methyltransferase
LADLLLLNIGCGPHAPEGWENIDRSPNLLLDRIPGAKQMLHRIGLLSDAHMEAWPRNVRRMNVLKGLPHADESVDGIYSSHTLEHLYLDDAQRLVAECRRVLRRGAVMRVALPDGEEWARALIQGEAGAEETPGLAYNKRLGAHPFARPTGRRAALALTAGHLHRWQPTRDLVTMMFRRAGFAEVTECQFKEGRLPRLDVVEFRPESFFLEAT